MVAQSPPYALQNSAHSAALFRQATSSAFLPGGGVLAAGELAVTAQATPNMSVAVAGGRAWIPGTQIANVTGQTFSTQAAYFGLNDAPVSLTISAADPTNPRIDRVVAYVQDAFYSGAVNSLSLAVVTGTPAASPSAPAAPSNALTLATVAVAANATSITTANITVTPPATLLAIARGGTDPVIATDVAAGNYVGQRRDHPTSGSQRWSGTAWQNEGVGLDAPLFRYRRSAGFSLPTGGFTTITFDVVDSTSGGVTYVNSSATVPRAGYYWVHGEVSITAATGGRLVVSIGHNGARVYVGRGQPNGSVAEGGAEVSGLIACNANDTLYLEAYQDSGAAQVTNNSVYAPTVLEAVWLRPL